MTPDLLSATVSVVSTPSAAPLNPASTRHAPVPLWTRTSRDSPDAVVSIFNSKVPDWSSATVVEGDVSSTTKGADEAVATTGAAAAAETGGAGTTGAGVAMAEVSAAEEAAAGGTAVAPALEDAASSFVANLIAFDAEGFSFGVGGVVGGVVTVLVGLPCGGAVLGVVCFRADLIFSGVLVIVTLGFSLFVKTSGALNKACSASM